MRTSLAECPTCKQSERVEFEGLETAIQTEDCAGCGSPLCDNCESFICTGCDEIFCVAHRIQFDGEQACPACALFWAGEAQRNLDRVLESRTLQAISRRAS